VTHTRVGVKCGNSQKILTLVELWVKIVICKGAAFSLQALKVGCCKNIKLSKHREWRRSDADVLIVLVAAN